MAGLLAVPAAVRGPSSAVPASAAEAAAIAGRSAGGRDVPRGIAREPVPAATRIAREHRAAAAAAGDDNRRPAACAAGGDVAGAPGPRRARGLGGPRRRPRRTRRLGRLRMTADDLAEVARLDQPVRFHLLEDAAPAFFPLQGGDLVQGQGVRAAWRMLRIEQRLGDLLAAWRQVLESTR